MGYVYECGSITQRAQHSLIMEIRLKFHGDPYLNQPDHYSVGSLQVLCSIPYWEPTKKVASGWLGCYGFQYIPQLRGTGLSGHGLLHFQAITGAARP